MKVAPTFWVVNWTEVLPSHVAPETPTTMTMLAVGSTFSTENWPRPMRIARSQR